MRWKRVAGSTSWLPSPALMRWPALSARNLSPALSVPSLDPLAPPVLHTASLLVEVRQRDRGGRGEGDRSRTGEGGKEVRQFRLTTPILAAAE